MNRVTTVKHIVGPMVGSTMENSTAATRASNGKMERGVGERGIQGNGRVLTWAICQEGVAVIEVGRTEEGVGSKEDQKLVVDRLR